MKKLSYGLLFILICVACSKNQDGTSTQIDPPEIDVSKAMTSSWTKTDWSLSVDMSTLSYGGSNTLVFTYANGGKCSCTMDVNGNDGYANYETTVCSQTSTTAPPRSCNDMVYEVGWFTMTAGVLKYCPAGKCIGMNCDYYQCPGPPNFCCSEYH